MKLSAAQFELLEHITTQQQRLACMCHCCNNQRIYAPQGAGNEGHRTKNAHLGRNCEENGNLAQAKVAIKFAGKALATGTESGMMLYAGENNSSTHALVRLLSLHADRLGRPGSRTILRPIVSAPVAQGLPHSDLANTTIKYW